MKKFDYDLIVIGSGVAGKTAALMAASAGKKVAIVEAGTWGGSQSSYDVPMAAAKHMSHIYFSAIEGEKFGIASSNLKFNYPTVINWIETARSRAGIGDTKELTEAGITCVKGFAQFLSANEIAVGEEGKMTSAKFLIATGSTPTNPNITGANFVPGGVTLGSDEEISKSVILPTGVFELKRIPKVALVVGAGATGCEVAEYLAEMGSKVLLSEISERVLPKEDPEAGEVIEKRLTEIGVKVLTGTRVLAVQDGGAQTLPNGRKVRAVKASFILGGEEKSVRVETVVLATGTSPMTDLGLNNAGVKFTNKGITTNVNMQTNVKNIYAAGDCAAVKIEHKPGMKNAPAEVPNISSPERGSYEAAVAASNILGTGRPFVDYKGFVRMTNTNPAVACLGLTEDECIVRDKKCMQILMPINRIFSANVSDFPDGFVKILVNKDRNKIMGATIVAPNADLIAQELALAIRNNIPLIELAATPHVSESWSEALKVAAKRLANSNTK
ncbi:MAG: NAD(P)/FAD-dependent oxidoreductase [Candidatus Saccharibacteria bacterium]|nr:NAD(P)/FAD-dependent oxidoreductase [Candidatus Saccharibacteria bacterium]